MGLIYISSGDNMVSGCGCGWSETSEWRVFGSRLTVFNRSKRNKIPLSILKHSQIIHRRGMRAREVKTSLDVVSKVVWIDEGNNIGKR
jgi:hypothetical protein